jgi:hypothetical protein
MKDHICGGTVGKISPGILVIRSTVALLVVVM